MAPTEPSRPTGAAALRRRFAACAPDGAHRRAWGTAATFGVAALVSWGVASPPVLAPQPAQAVKSLSGSTGATAAAIYVEYKPRPGVVKWPTGFTAGSAAAGTPCSNIDLLPGEPVTMHIQVLGSSRRCVPLSYPPVFGQAPPPAPACGTSTIVTSPGNGGVAEAVQVSTTPTHIIKWSELWTTAQPTPAAGSACSPVDMAAGESTLKHIQIWLAGSLWSRCVDNTLPAYAN